MESPRERLTRISKETRRELEKREREEEEEVQHSHTRGGGRESPRGFLEHGDVQGAPPLSFI